MKYKKIFLLSSLFILLVPIIDVKAFTFVDYIKDGNYAFFLFNLDGGNTTQISVTRQESGNFTLFLFDQRPIESYVKNDKTLNDKIFSKTSIIDFSLADNPDINYTNLDPDPKIYYIEVMLVGGGPDTYNLTCNKDLTRYYLPIIPGFNLEIALISSTAVVGILILFFKRKKVIRQ
ncbi:hypothetical protein LCGC14_0765500 [marine sediment metagenome]|uniref:Uncharacterized protein n=1 Tax=marine sediment metagenome TaxID=412755 RepID=A0A0F9QJM3_9ZZZZ|nr:MAG: hypothetical protein Lokiarch_43040 [Candidatus Lokiarchaeum sp. GC14_75]HEC38932.1 hypothetical protein [bacterium]